MSDSSSTSTAQVWAEAFIAGFRSPDTRRAYRRDLSCWLDYCADHDLHPYTGVRRTHVEGYLRHLEDHRPPLPNTTLRRRICTLSSWFSWLEDEEVSVGNPAGRVRRPRRHRADRRARRWQKPRAAIRTR